MLNKHYEVYSTENSTSTILINMKTTADDDLLTTTPTKYSKKKMPIVCHPCQRWFFSKDRLILHKWMHHEIEICTFCLELFNSIEQKQQHEKLQHGHLNCDMCPEISSNENGLINHYRLNHDTKLCQFCGILVHPISNYKDHIIKKHLIRPDIEDLLSSNLRIITQWSSDSSSWNFYCNLCDKLRQRSEIFGHFHNYHRLSLEAFVKCLTIEGIKFEIPGALRDASNELCKVCQLDEVPLVLHQIWCLRRLPCSHCPKTFLDEHALLSHINVEHDLFSCPNNSECQLAFETHELLLAHLEKSHGCDFCNLCVDYVDNMTSHLRFHGIESLENFSKNIFVIQNDGLHIICQLCSPSLNLDYNLSALYSHMQIHNISLVPQMSQLRYFIENQSSMEKQSFTPTNKKDHQLEIYGEENSTNSTSQEFEDTSSEDEESCASSEIDKLEEDIDDIGYSDYDPSELICLYETTSEDDDLPLVSNPFNDKSSPSLEMQLNDNLKKKKKRKKSKNTENSENEEEENEEISLNKKDTNNSLKCQEEAINLIQFPSRLNIESSSPEGKVSLSSNIFCPLCESTIESVDFGDLLQHINVHHAIHLEQHQQISVTPLFCPFCHQKATHYTTLRRHIRKEHGNKLIESLPKDDVGIICRYCPEKYWTIHNRRKHELNAHKIIQELYRCYICDQQVDSLKSLSGHVLSTHSSHNLSPNKRLLDDIYDNSSRYNLLWLQCRICNQILPASKTLLKNHFINYHKSNIIYRCIRCRINLKSKKTFRAHIKNVHIDFGQKDCTLCGKVLWSKRALSIHHRMKHSNVSKIGFRCRICQKRYDTKDERKLHYQVDHRGESPYHCLECGKGFASKSGMYGHKQLHSGSGMSTCPYCSKEFTRKDSYNEHLLIHTGPRHRCPHCNKEFVQRSNLVRHIRIHTGEKPYKCVYCDKCFSDKGACNSHIRVHTKEEACSCPYCGQTFSKKQKLKYHIRKHTGEGLITCEICNKTFTNSFALKEHRLIHNRETQILCSTCGKAFNSEKYLTRHITLVHEPSQLYRCPFCSKVCTQPSRLKSHLMTHAGLKHLKCLLCEKAYSVRKSLRRHLLDKHQIGYDHPQYRNCFYAMSPSEAGLRMPQGEPFSVEQLTTQELAGLEETDDDEDELLKDVEILNQREENGENVENEGLKPSKATLFKTDLESTTMSSKPTFPITSSLKLKANQKKKRVESIVEFLQNNPSLKQQQISATTTSTTTHDHLLESSEKICSAFNLTMNNMSLKGKFKMGHQQTKMATSSPTTSTSSIKSFANNNR